MPAKKARKTRKANRQESAKHQQHWKWVIWWKKNNKAKRKTTSKNKASKEIHIQSHNAKQQANASTNNCGIRMCTHDTKCRNETSKKTATLILQLCNENKCYQHQTKTQSTEKSLAKKARKNQYKKNARSHTTFACNPEANLANGAHRGKVPQIIFFK